MAQTLGHCREEKEEEKKKRIELIHRGLQSKGQHGSCSSGLFVQRLSAKCFKVYLRNRIKGFVLKLCFHCKSSNCWPGNVQAQSSIQMRDKHLFSLWIDKHFQEERFAKTEMKQWPGQMTPHMFFGANSMSIQSRCFRNNEFFHLWEWVIIKTELFDSEGKGEDVSQVMHTQEKSQKVAWSLIYCLTKSVINGFSPLFSIIF